MYIEVQGPGTVQFQWKVSSESGYDLLEFTVDGNYYDSISGAQDWAQKSSTITGSGSHRLHWRYYKDGSESVGDDCGYVKSVTFTPSPLPSPDYLAEAVDAGLTFTTSGTGAWGTEVDPGRNTAGRNTGSSI